MVTRERLAVAGRHSLKRRRGYPGKVQGQDCRVGLPSATNGSSGGAGQAQGTAAEQVIQAAVPAPDGP
eukprot:scaffold781_cov394-Prasinococcus_capsulatus_cf.AAC.19